MKDLFRSFSLADIFSDAPEGVVFLDEMGQILKVNSAFCRMVDSRPSPQMNISHYIAVQDKEAWEKQFDFFMGSEKTHLVVVSRFLSNRTDKVRWWQLTIKKIKKDSFKGLVVLISDFTRIKELEARQRKAKEQAEAATRGKSEILANTSHEIRTPIHTIIGMSDLMSDTRLDEEQQEYSSQIQFAASVLLSLVNDILDISKIEAGKIEIEYTDFDLHQLVQALVNLETLEVHKKGLELAYYISPLVPQYVLGDPVRIRQIITNLVSNARKFTPTGHIILSLETRGDRGGKLFFTVRDTGIGIPEHQQNKLFSAFQQADSSTTRKYGGTGLGLFICRNLVSQMGGSMGLSSIEGEGTCFSFTLEMEKVVKANTTPGVGADFFEGIRVLLIDDNDNIRQITKKYLKEWGCRVDEADNAERALELIRKGGGVKTYSVCIVDQAMRKMDGWQLASEIRADDKIKDLPLILTSLKGKGSDEAKMKLLGWFDDYLTKPIAKKELLEKMYHTLNQNQEGHAPAELVPELEALDEGGLDIEQARSDWIGKDILVVEDHHVNQQLFRTILERQSCLVRCVDNGKLALNSVKKSIPDLIFMDCQMPIMNGYESTKEIRKLGIHIPIVAVTASALRGEREKCEKAGMNDLITKPFNKMDIQKILFQYFSQDKEGALVMDDNSDEIINIVDLTDPPQLEGDKGIFNYQAALKTFLGNSEVLDGLLEPYRKKVDGQIQSLKANGGYHDLDNVRDVAHSIKGSSRNLDMNRLGNVAEKLEHAGRDNNPTPIPSLLEEIEEEFNLLCGVLKKYT